MSIAGGEVPLVRIVGVPDGRCEGDGVRQLLLGAADGCKDVVMLMVGVGVTLVCEAVGESLGVRDGEAVAKLLGDADSIAFGVSENEVG